MQVKIYGTPDNGALACKAFSMHFPRRHFRFSSRFFFSSVQGPKSLSLSARKACSHVQYVFWVPVWVCMGVCGFSRFPFALCLWPHFFFCLYLSLSLCVPQHSHSQRTNTHTHRQKHLVEYGVPPHKVNATWKSLLFMPLSHGSKRWDRVYWAKVVKQRDF